MEILKLNQDEKERIYKAKKTQITCPKCKHEFGFDSENIQLKLKQLRKKKHIMHQQLTSYEKGIKKIEQDEKWYRKTKEKYLEACSKIYSLEQQHSKLWEQQELNNHILLKEIIKEFYGKEEFIRCIDEMSRRSKAYTVESTMHVKNNLHNEGGILNKLIA